MTAHQFSPVSVMTRPQDPGSKFFHLEHRAPSAAGKALRPIACDPVCSLGLKPQKATAYDIAFRRKGFGVPDAFVEISFCFLPGGRMNATWFFLRSKRLHTLLRLSRFSCEARASDSNAPGRRRKKGVPYVYSGGVNIENVAVFQESSSSVSGSESWGAGAASLREMRWLLSEVAWQPKWQVPFVETLPGRPLRPYNDL